jgi:hypothetical protein
MDVGPVIVAVAQATELIQPSKRALDDPPPPAQTTSVRRATPRYQRANPTRAQRAGRGRGFAKGRLRAQSFAAVAQSRTLLRCYLLHAARRTSTFLP